MKCWKIINWRLYRVKRDSNGKVCEAYLFHLLPKIKIMWGVLEND